MTSLPRLLVLLGSGETSPTMTTPHQRLFAQLGRVDALLLDTPYGFQANREDLNAKALGYFRTSVGREVTVASYRAVPDGDTLAEETALSKIRQAGWVFAGPGSPTYALDRWAGSPLPDVLVDKLARGGAVVFASAAVLTLGTHTVPVYEIYKCGAPAQWRPGLDVVRAATGLSCAVIPHYDNAEGGNHDTRFCYLGETRLSAMEAQLPDGTFVLGVDEHTGLVCDLGARTATVIGRGSVTVRVRGISETLVSGTEITLDELAALGAGGHPTARPAAPAATMDSDPGGNRAERPSLGADIRRCSEAFDAALVSRDVDAAVRAVLELEEALAGWAADTLQSDDADRARAALRGMVVRLGDLARTGAADPRELVGPYVEALLAARRAAREDKRYADADGFRDTLVAAGVEVRDTPLGVEWSLR